MLPGKKYKRYFIRQYSFLEYMHGGIGFADAETILMNEAYQPITFPCHDRFSVRAKWIRSFYLLKSFFFYKRSVNSRFYLPRLCRNGKIIVETFEP